MKSKIIIFLSLCVFTLILAGHFQGAQAAQVSKTRWLKHMETALPELFCQEKQFFRQCFDISAERCQQVAASTTRTCLDKYAEKIPGLLNQPEDGSHWGRIVGRCTGEAFELALKQKMIRSARCRNVDNWR